MDAVWRRTVQIACLLLALALLAFVLRKALGKLCLLLLLAATLAYLLAPLASRLPFSTGWNAGLSFFAILMLLGLFAYFGIPALLRQLLGLRDSLPAVLQYADTIAQRLERFLRGAGVPESSLAFAQERALQWLGALAERAAGGLMSAGNAVLSAWYLLLSPVIAFYMLRDRARLFDTLLRLIPGRLRLSTQELGLRIKRELGDYVRGQLTVSLVTGSLTALGLLFVGLPSWLVMGLIMVLLNLIPYFGPLLAAIPILVFSLPRGLVSALLSLAVVLLAQQIESLVVAPRIIGQAAQLHPGLVIVSLSVGSWLFGFAGLFFSIPAVLSVRAFISTVRDIRLRALGKIN